MNPPTKSLIRQKNLQPCTLSTSAAKFAKRGPQRNALTHGLRSGHVLLPGDNVAEFRTLRHRLFHLHRPRTIAEARHVETLAANAWRAARCHLEQRFFKHHLGAAMSGHPDATGSLCSPDLHALHHRGTDCQREERRLEISTSEAETALKRMQHERTQQLTPGRAAVLEDYTVFLDEGEPVVEDEWEAEADPDVEAPEEGASEEAGKTGATGSADEGNSNGPKRNPDASGLRFPGNSNRRQRRRRLAALRRKTGREAARRVADG